MGFETIRKSHKKSIVIGAIIFIILAIVLVVRLTFAKYNLVKSIKIAEGTINYKVPDFKIMAMYKNDGSGYTEIDTMPESGYAINESKSYCELNGNKDSNVQVYSDEELHHIISNITKGSKCYLYFDNYRKVNTSLGEITVKLANPDFSKTSCTSGCEETTVGIYQAKDDDGMSYYYRGDVENNYVKFANKWCRIVRINGDGSIRLIYDGTSAHQNGEVTTDSIAVSNVKWSHKDAVTGDEYSKNIAYVGFKYTLGEAHGLGTKSNALQELETWYQNNLASFANKIDINAGFCGDRTSYIKSGESYILGVGDKLHFGSVIRVSINNKPSLKCPNMSDYYTVTSSNKGNNSLTYPIALITEDEVAVSGGFYKKANASYYLYNGQSYWSMSPYSYSKDDNICSTGATYIYSSGEINSSRTNSVNLGLRPVINLKADIVFTFTGTGEKGSISNPYIVL